jgi:hypothetical protein
MTGHDDLLLGDYVDGTLGGPALARLEAHLSSCARCRAMAADFRAIREGARALEPHAPPAALWAAVACAAERRQPWWRLPLAGFAAWRPLGASAFAFVAAATLWSVGHRLALVVPGAAAPSAASRAEAWPLESSLRTAEAEYATAIAGLEQLAGAGRDALDPETADAIRANLDVIDHAIGESRVALEQEPDSDLAQASLFEAFRQKVALLQDTLALVNEMRKGNPEGAARIASGLRQ